ncbi:uncharacterized protein LOC109580079 [Bactrocera dorsalis]|uniref:Uncharacterized protein LOC109580079 n=1 Tax=Bactrocera dorsalis TaxID=27457 RepID=A0ABM3JNE4_BACDO|nr:uncharacterized protein LOC109580079 [Bactrocera dorsalis]
MPEELISNISFQSSTIDPLKNSDFDTDNTNRSKWHRKLIANVTGVYSQPQPDIGRRNNLAGHSHKSWLLRNGNFVKKPTLINTNHHFAINTCGFDSIIQILSTAAMDDENYNQEMINSENPTLKFVSDFVKNGPSQRIENDRVKLLTELFPSKECIGVIKALKSYIVDLKDYLSSIVKKCFQSKPSALRHYTCLNCGEYTVPVPLLYINHKNFREPNGFEALKDLQAFNEHKRYSCINSSCEMQCSVNTVYSNQVFVELNVRPDLSYKSGKRCRLKEFPTTLELNATIYRLAGVIHYESEHFTAYCFRGMVRWELHDDQQSKIKFCHSTTRVTPEAAVYVQLNEENYSTFTGPIKADSSQKEFHYVTPDEDPDTNSRDNWRNKENSSLYCIDTKNFYTDVFKEKKCDDREVKLHQNGDSQSAIAIKGDVIHVRKNSCLDSIIHVLWYATECNTNYLTLMRYATTENDTLKLIAQLVDNENLQSTNEHRVLVSPSFVETQIYHISPSIDSEISTIDLTTSGTSAKVWKACFDSVPSEQKLYNCNICGEYVENIAVLCPNFFNRSQKCIDLQKALHFYKYLKKVRCIKESCPGKCVVTTSSNFHLFIDISQSSMCLIDEISTVICREFNYRLAGIISRLGDRYVAYCSALQNWLLYDGYHKVNKTIVGCEQIRPSGLIYVLQD